MGQRANLILVEASKYQLFYSHWCANTLPRDLFWGPDHALAFIRIQREVDESGWLDEVWAEGGAVLDPDRKVFLFYGGEDLLYDAHLRRTYLELLARVWDGWTVRWAYEGIADLAGYVGCPRDRVLSYREPERTNATLTPPQQNNWTDIVASIRFADGNIRFFPLQGDVKFYLACGSKLAHCIRMTDGLPRLLLDEWTTQFPTGGFHLDLEAQTLDFWTAPDTPDIADRVAAAWPGWETRWHFDRYEAQLDRADGLLRFPSPDTQVLLGLCREILLAEPGPRFEIESTIHTLAEHVQFKDIQVNPWALRDDRLALPREERIAIFEAAAAKVATC